MARRVIRREPVTKAIEDLARACPDIFTMWVRAYNLVVAYGLQAPAHDDTLVKRIVGTDLDITELRAQGECKGLWRAYRTIVIHHDDDTLLLFLMHGDKHQRPDWYKQVIPTAEALYAEWLSEQSKETTDEQDQD